VVRNTSSRRTLSLVVSGGTFLHGTATPPLSSLYARASTMETHILGPKPELDVDTTIQGALAIPGAIHRMHHERAQWEQQKFWLERIEDIMDCDTPTTDEEQREARAARVGRSRRTTYDNPPTPNLHVRIDSNPFDHDCSTLADGGAGYGFITSPKVRCMLICGWWICCVAGIALWIVWVRVFARRVGSASYSRTAVRWNVAVSAKPGVEERERTPRAECETAHVCRALT
jgi:hypothetical protein